MFTSLEKVSKKYFKSTSQTQLCIKNLFCQWCKTEFFRETDLKKHEERHLCQNDDTKQEIRGTERRLLNKNNHGRNYTQDNFLLMHPVSYEPMWRSDLPEWEQDFLDDYRTRSDLLFNFNEDEYEMEAYYNSAEGVEDRAQLFNNPEEQPEDDLLPDQNIIQFLENRRLFPRGIQADEELFDLLQSPRLEQNSSNNSLFDDSLE